MRRMLTDLGAADVSVPLIAIAEPTDGGTALRDAAARLDTYDWLVVTSPNGADCMVTALDGKSVPDSVAVAAIGPGTADRLGVHGVDVDFVPDRSVAESLVEQFPDPTVAGATRVLLAQAEVARPTVADGLRQAGWSVDVVAAYRTVDAVVSDDDRARIAAADVVTFTSSSTVDRFVDLVGIDHLPQTVVCIGPITAATARAHGIAVDVEAEEHTIDGLVDAVVAFHCD